MNAPITLTSLAAAWRAAKADEDAAKQRRIDIEAEIVDSFPIEIEGTDSRDAGPYKVTVVHKMNRSVNTDALQQLWPRLNDKAQACFSWKATVKVGELRKVQEFLPDSYVLLATVIEAKPAKPSVSVEAL